MYYRNDQMPVIILIHRSTDSLEGLCNFHFKICSCILRGDLQTVRGVDVLDQKQTIITSKDKVTEVPEGRLKQKFTD